MRQRSAAAPGRTAAAGKIGGKIGRLGKAAIREGGHREERMSLAARRGEAKRNETKKKRRKEDRELGSIARMPEVSVSMPIGVVVRKSPGVTRWARWIWRPVAVLPGAGPASWKLLRQEGMAREYHAATVEIELWRKETQAYVGALSTSPPSVYVVMRDAGDTTDDQQPEVLLVTASPYEAQDYADSGEEMVEPVPMPPGLQAWIRDFVARHHEEEEFVKRRRDRVRVDRRQDGVGDARVRQPSDVYRAPSALRRNGVLQ